MLRRGIILAFAIAALVFAITSAVRASDAVASPWQNSGSPTLQKSVEQAPNVIPSAANFDCTGETVPLYGSTANQQDCMVTVPFGQVGSNGIVFSGTNDSIPVVPGWPFYGLQAIPNQSMLITYSSGPILGSYINFYTSIRDKMSSVPQFVNGSWQYTLTGNPDFSLRDANHKLLIGNTSAMGFSPNGSWMVIDLPWQGFVRVNLATFDILPFAPSMQQGSDYSNQAAQLAISNDGQQVVVKPSNFNYFKVYNLGNCNANTALPVDPASDRCASRDYYGDITSQISGYRALYQPRFINDTQISFSAVYDYAPGNFKVATYTLTAPGTSPSGIDYLGMGDSYASGEGAYAYTTDTDTDNNRCHVSSNAYAFVLTSELFQSGHSVACSGAVTTDIMNDSNDYSGQVKVKIKKQYRDNIQTVVASYTPGFISQSEFVDQYKPQAVTLSIGGNDIGFSDIIKSCISPTIIHTSCYSTYEDRLELDQQINSIFDRLVATYKTVAKPGKRVYVIGYPHIFASGGNCAANVHFDVSEIQMATDLTDYLNQTISRAADKAGVRYVDVGDAFNGHRLCETKSSNVAINGLTAGQDMGGGPLKFIGSESYHPNALGHQLLAQAIRLQTNNLQLAMPSTNSNVQAPGLPDSLNQSSLPKSGRAINTVVASDGLTTDAVVRGQDTTLSLDATTASLKPSSSYSVGLGVAAKFGSVTSNAAGTISTTIRIPDDTTPGFQVLHVDGPNLLGQPIDVTQTVFVAASTDDYNGDGIPNSSDPCILVESSHQDSDKDGIDDACDPLISEPPAQRLTHLSSSVTMTGNSIEITLIKP